MMNLNEHDFYELYFEKGMPTMNIDVYTCEDTGEIFMGLPGMKQFAEENPEDPANWYVLDDRAYKTNNISEILENLVVLVNQPNVKYNPERYKKIYSQINGLELLQERIYDFEYDLEEMDEER